MTPQWSTHRREADSPARSDRQRDRSAFRGPPGKPSPPKSPSDDDTSTSTVRSSPADPESQPEDLPDVTNRSPRRAHKRQPEFRWPPGMPRPSKYPSDDETSTRAVRGSSASSQSQSEDLPDVANRSPRRGLKRQHDETMTMDEFYMMVVGIDKAPSRVAGEKDEDKDKNKGEDEEVNVRVRFCRPGGTVHDGSSRECGLSCALEKHSGRCPGQSRRLCSSLKLNSASAIEIAAASTEEIQPSSFRSKVPSVFGEEDATVSQKRPSKRARTGLSSDRNPSSSSKRGEAKGKDQHILELQGRCRALENSKKIYLKVNRFLIRKSQETEASIRQLREKFSCRWCNRNEIAFVASCCGYLFCKSCAQDWEDECLACAKKGGKESLAALA